MKDIFHQGLITEQISAFVPQMILMDQAKEKMTQNQKMFKSF